MKLIRFLLRSTNDVRHSRANFAFVLITSVIGGVASAALLAIISAALTQQAIPTSTLVWSFVGVCLVFTVTRIVSQVILFRFVTKVLFELRMKMCRRILSVPLRQLEKEGAPRLLTCLTDDIPTISGTVSSLPLLATQGAIVVGCIAYLIWLSWMVFLIIAGFIIIGAIIYHLSIKKAVGVNKLAREQWDILFKNFRGLIEGAKELKLHRERREDFVDKGLKATSETLRNHRIAANTIYISANSWSQILSFIIIGILIFALPRLRGTDLHVLTSYTLIFFYMLGPLQSVLTSIPGLGQTRVAIDRVEELGLSLEANPIEIESALEADRDMRWRKLELAGATHAYHRERENSSFVLGPIDMVLYPNELVFVTGGNGSGKTTFVKMLTGLYAPETGEIRLDDQPITDENRDYYRQRFSAVFSDFFLFESFFGLNSSELEAQTRDYLIQLQLDHKVEMQDGALSTTDLSQGQRKRLALLTAYLEDRSIYVFDEWAADQDPQFKEIFYYQILPGLKARGKTVIVISHDDRYYNIADRVIKLDYGKIASDSYVTRPEYASADMPGPLMPNPVGG